MDDNDRPGDDDLLNIDLDDLDEVEDTPPMPALRPSADAISIELEDLDDEPPANAWQPPAPGGYPSVGPAGMAYPVVDAKSAHDLYTKAKKNPVAAIFGNLMVQMLIAGLIAGFLAWLATEPWTEDSGQREDITSLYLYTMLFFGLIGAIVGMVLGAVEGLLSSAFMRMLRDAGLGLAIGAVGGAIAGFAGQLVYGTITGGAAEPSLPAVLVGRTIGWALAGLAIGVAQGARYFAWNRIVNGLIGGAVGGTIGGLLFDPIGMIVGGGEMSRLVALVVIGGATGAAIGLLEEVRKEAWLTVVEGPMTGKEFILYKQVTIIGSAGFCDIPLFKQPGVAPEHTRIEQQGNSFTAICVAGPDAMAINGVPTPRQPLRSGDLIHIGQTGFYYQDRAAGPAAGSY